MKIIAQNQDFESWCKSLHNPLVDEYGEMGQLSGPFDRPGCFTRRYDRTWRAVLGPEAGTKDWQGKVWRFPDGTVEVSVTRVDSLKRLQQSRYLLMGQPIRMYSKDIQLSEEELAEFEAAREAENRRRAARRAAQKIRHLIRMIDGNHMLTLSYRQNMQDIEQLKADWKRFVRLVHAKHPNWKFVAVRERQERGALHLHVAVAGRQDIKYLRRCRYVALGSSPSVTGSETPGQIDIRAPWKRWGGTGGYSWEANKLAAYLTKYLAKTFEEEYELNSKRYWHSKDVKTPEPQRIWLGATSIIDAIVETHDLVRTEAGGVDAMWLKEGWGELPSVFRLPRSGFHATSFSVCPELIQSFMN